MVWGAGEVVVVREVWLGRVFTARPWIVVSDDPDRLLLWIWRGTRTMTPDGPHIPSDDWTLVEGEFARNALRIVTPGGRHSILHFFGDDGGFEGWYVNIERPFRRSAVGFDFLDLELDLFVRPDGSWDLLDEDELDEAVARGVIAVGEAAQVRAEADRVLAAWPFPTGYEDFSPDPDWQKRPALPAGWDTIF